MPPTNYYYIAYVPIGILVEMFTVHKAQSIHMRKAFGGGCDSP